MKRNKFNFMLVLAALVLAAATACYKDKGNYDYAPTNEITIQLDTIANNGTISANQGDVLRLNPTLTQSLAKDEARLSFEWKIYDNTAGGSLANPRIVIANSRNLEIAIGEPNFTLGQRYRIVYTVTDTVTKIASFAMFNLQVSNRFASGWVILEDLPNGGDFSMILPGDVVEHKVYSQINPGTPMGSGTPVGLDVSFEALDDGITPSSKKFYVYHPNGGIEINYTNLRKKFDMPTLFFNPPAVLKPQSVSFWSYPNQTFLASFCTMVSNGKVYISEAGGYPGAKKYGSELAMANNSPDYQVAPQAWNGLSWPIVFDTRNKRFHIVRSTKLDNFPDTVSTVANLNNLGKDLVYMDEANAPRAYNTILKDDAGLRHLLRITFSTTDYVLTSFIQVMNAPEIESAKAFASSQASPHLFYGAGNKLYRYETTSHTATQSYSFPNGEHITGIRIRNGVEMIIATWNGTAGKVYKFEINNTGAIKDGTFTREYAGFARIIDMRYKS